MISNKTIIDNIRILYENNEKYTNDMYKSYIKNIYVFKQLISDKYTLDLSDINTDNNTLIFSYIINNIINNIHSYITDTTITFNSNVKITDNLNYFKNIKYNIKKIIDIINNYIRYDTNQKISNDSYDINSLIINYFIENDYWINHQLNSKDFNEILLDIFINFILKLTINKSRPIYINFGTIVNFKINEILTIVNINSVIYLYNDKIVFNLKQYLDIYLSINHTLYDTNSYIKNFIDDINELDTIINRDKIIDIDDIIINNNNKRINIQFLSAYINTFKNIKQENDSNYIIKQLESLIINSESIDKPDNYIDNYYDKNFGQGKLYSTKEEVYINIPKDLYKENIKISFEQIACKNKNIETNVLYRVDTKSTFINIIINELEKQKIYYTKDDILEFLKKDSNDYIIIKKTINNIILFILLEIIINTYYNNKENIYDDITYLYIYIDIYKSLVFTTDSNIIDLKKTLGKYLYNKYYNNYNYIVLYSNNNEDENYDIIYIYIKKM